MILSIYHFNVFDTNSNYCLVDKIDDLEFDFIIVLNLCDYEDDDAPI